MSEIARAYVELAHDIEFYQPGYIDGYYGPPAWSKRQKRPLAQLADEAQQLVRAVEGVADEQRRIYLRSHLRAMQTSIALLAGERIAYRDEIRLLYDIEPEPVPEAHFEQAIQSLDELLPGTGDIASREQAFRAGFEIPVERLLSLFDMIVDELRTRTWAHFGLPESEVFEAQLVKNKPWGAYNWYLGNYRSRIDLNTDLPQVLTSLPDLIAHEAYPGHHTEMALKEELLWCQKKQAEHTLLLLNAPSSVISEGIAVHAREMVISDEELHEWLVEHLAEPAGLVGRDVERMFVIEQRKRILQSVMGNAGFLYHEEKASKKEVIQYILRYSLRKRQSAEKFFEFLSHPNYRSYIFTYTYGAQLLNQLFKKGKPERWFARLLREALTPSMVQAWCGERGE